MEMVLNIIFLGLSCFALGISLATHWWHPLYESAFNRAKANEETAEFYKKMYFNR